jgi:hypothetical protein
MLTAEYKSAFPGDQRPQILTLDCAAKMFPAVYLILRIRCLIIVYK